MKDWRNIMNENYLVTYVNTNGILCKRKIFERTRIILFAGLKFLLDRLIAVFGLIVASPIMLIIAIAIKLDSKGKVLFKQERTGKGGKNFYIYKFRLPFYYFICLVFCQLPECVL